MNKGGRPPIWTDPIAFDKAVDEYFNNTEIIHTWSGLALHLGFVSRSSLYEYGQEQEFSASIKKALLRIESIYEQRMMSARNPSGAIFALKNFGWRDKQEVEQKTEGKLEVTVKYAKRDNNTSRATP